MPDWELRKEVRYSISIILTQGKHASLEVQEEKTNI